MNKKAILLIVLLLASMVFMSGCVTQNPVKSQEDVTTTVDDISTNIEDVESKLQDIDQGLG